MSIVYYFLQIASLLNWREKASLTLLAHDVPTVTRVPPLPGPPGRLSISLVPATRLHSSVCVCSLSPIAHAHGLLELEALEIIKRQTLLLQMRIHLETQRISGLVMNGDDKSCHLLRTQYVQDDLCASPAKCRYLPIVQTGNGGRISDGTRQGQEGKPGLCPAASAGPQACSHCPRRWRRLGPSPQGEERLLSCEQSRPGPSGPRESLDFFFFFEPRVMLNQNKTSRAENESPSICFIRIIFMIKQGIYFQFLMTQ